MVLKLYNNMPQTWITRIIAQGSNRCIPKRLSNKVNAPSPCSRLPLHSNSSIAGRLAFRTYINPLFRQEIRINQIVRLDAPQLVLKRRYCEEALDETTENCTLPPAQPLEWNIFAAPDLLIKYQGAAVGTKLDLPKLLETAKENIRKTLKYSFKITPSGQESSNAEKILVVYDTNCLLTEILAQAYGSVLNPTSTLMVNFEQANSAQLKATIDTMKAGDMVVLVQSNGFRLNDYRLRIELFKVGIKNLEHAHLDMMPDEQIETYINAMQFAPTPETKTLAHNIKNLIDTSQRFVVRSKGGSECVYECDMEPALLNIGDYEGMKGVGGTFPVGEVFSEPKDLDKVNGEFMVFAFPNRSFDMQHLDIPFKIKIEKGQLVESIDAPEAFLEVLEVIRSQEGEEGGGIRIREFGVGLNTALGRQNPLQNVTAFERQAGFHISLGRKHTVFKKTGISHKKSRMHIDVFVDLDHIQLGEKIVYKNDAFCL